VKSIAISFIHHFSFSTLAWKVFTIPALRDLSLLICHVNQPVVVTIIRHWFTTDYIYFLWWAVLQPELGGQHLTSWLRTPTLGQQLHVLGWCNGCGQWLTSRTTALVHSKGTWFHVAGSVYWSRAVARHIQATLAASEVSMGSSWHIVHHCMTPSVLGSFAVACEHVCGW
jgi:hypothetical protein